jgi:hypothetical protein
MCAGPSDDPPPPRTEGPVGDDPADLALALEAVDDRHGLLQVRPEPLLDRRRVVVRAPRRPEQSQSPRIDREHLRGTKTASLNSANPAPCDIACATVTVLHLVSVSTSTSTAPLNLDQPSPVCTPCVS